MLKYSKIKSPVFAVDMNIVRKNIKSIMDKLPKSCIFRPHFKTHNNKITAKIFREFGVSKITVSSVEMALYFRQLGFKDITIAFPINVREQRSLNKLSGNTKLGLLCSCISSVNILVKMPLIKADIWLEIDTGYNRSGISWNDFEQIENCIRVITSCSQLNFKGFLTHNGLTYNLQSKTDILASSTDSIKKLKSLKDRFSLFNPLISIGDTPACSIMKNFNDVDEIRPGNFVYYDLMMLTKNVCSREQIAATVLCPVVDLNPERSEIVIHGGAVHFSKESILVDNNIVFGKAIKHIGKTILDIDEHIISLSQEHGIIKLSKSKAEDYNIGDLIEIIPVHVCLTADLMKSKIVHYE
ncbi:MAG TPA: alanine racemase [Bacteroidales bacterium]|nr:alanine racemase [Bacteroidales bacterium]